MDYWTPTRDWEGQDAFLIGGGPSLLNFDFKQLAGKNTIGCNDAFKLGYDIVKICIFGDARWWHDNRFQLEQFEGKVVTNATSLTTINVPNLKKMKRVRDGLHTGNTLGWNYSTGAAAINLAVSLGATRIFLLGYDLSNKGHKSHWHKYNPKVTNEYSFRRFIGGFKLVHGDLPEGVKVYNVTDGSSLLPHFTKISFADLQELILKQEVAA